ncbi:hypothetical protein V5738_00590 [Salinisphaera sp. SPP-AMP-43]|uniref:nuclear transport factor 2 family protein n=1 Tax=Salinisphaera sp. SPP-AMP-43 TaxID=3121288 RepID=UPI003C6E3D60
MSRVSLPEPIAAYFEADRQNGPAVARCFTNNGVVVDEGQIHSGLAAIETWKTKTSAQTPYICEPILFELQGRKRVVTGLVAGNFPGSPILLRYIFVLERGQIASLEITP